ncbi:GNAT family N-acetyltransferase [Kitasatospora viridis]|uniref:GNAT acetyltransferase-like protein n=1 Tax=Kitasatospora viridis TaxID=281105 RepID=A0A561SF74_9ACTN|nr:GNAT family N-acetyltransferase [Kitasatospora viridis]TWF73526.1 GNAT acetyltransferase-like protein [Kitasatospora viridis]
MAGETTGEIAGDLSGGKAEDMTDDQLIVRARGLWCEMASVPGIEFAAAGRLVPVVAPEAGLGPAGWAGVIELGGARIATAPDERAAALLRERLAGVAPGRLADPGAVGAAFPDVRVLGPVALAYLAAEDFRPVGPGAWELVELPADHRGLRRLEESAGDEDRREAGLDEITSPAFAVRVGGEVVAAAGYRHWRSRTAHISVLTAPAWRGHGLVRVTGTAAAAHALADDLLPQWRARVPASRRAAVALGFREIGTQLVVNFG